MDLLLYGENLMGTGSEFLFFTQGQFWQISEMILENLLQIRSVTHHQTHSIALKYKIKQSENSKFKPIDFETQISLHR